MDDYLSKPYTQATLQDIVCRWITAGDRPIREATVNPDSGMVPGMKDVRGTVVRGGGRRTKCESRSDIAYAARFSRVRDCSMRIQVAHACR